MLYKSHHSEICFYQSRLQHAPISRLSACREQRNPPSSCGAYKRTRTWEKTLLACRSEIYRCSAKNYCVPRLDQCRIVFFVPLVVKILNMNLQDLTNVIRYWWEPLRQFLHWWTCCETMSRWWNINVNRNAESNRESENEHKCNAKPFSKHYEDSLNELNIRLDLGRGILEE